MKTTKFELGGALFLMEADGHYKQLYRINGDRKDLVAEYVTDAFGGLAINEMDCVGILAFVENVVNNTDTAPIEDELSEMEKAIRIRKFATHMNCKVSSLDDVTGVLDVSKLDAESKAILDSLPVRTVPFNIDLFDSFSIGAQSYIVESWLSGDAKPTRYFVDTQGYDYARYITKLV